MVEQQGLPGSALVSQPTRWSQGNLKAMCAEWHGVACAGWPSWPARVAGLPADALWQGVVGVTLVAALALAVSGQFPFWGNGPWWQLLFFYLLGFGGTVLGCVAARSGRGPRGWLAGIAIGQVYAFYSWLLWPALIRSAMRQLVRRQNWTKTEREPLAEAPQGTQAPVAELSRP